ncbi:hypothetical protein SSAG_06266 [Streptomyces sp. Mg1]|nr:hypothetical protein SSAG_06266 [Streptomyces sp. Mg1]
MDAYDPERDDQRAAVCRRADATITVLPSTGAPGPDPTSVMPPVRQPDAAHPWQSQMRAARDRNEQTQMQYLDPSEDPLRRRPQRQAPPPPQQRPQQPQQPPQYRQGPPPQQYRQQPQQPPQYQQPPQQQYAPPPPPQQYQQQQRQPQQYQQPQQPQYRQPQQQPPQAPPPQQRPPREPREPRRRSANPVRIPGLGCLKGCLVLILLFFVAGWLVWELTPLQEWVGTGKGWWDQVGTWVSDAYDWVSSVGNSADGPQS